MSDCSRVKLNSIRTHIISFVPLNKCKYLIYNDKKVQKNDQILCF